MSQSVVGWLGLKGGGVRGYVPRLVFRHFLALALFLLKGGLEGVDGCWWRGRVSGAVVRFGDEEEADGPVKTPRPAAITTAIAGPPALMISCDDVSSVLAGRDGNGEEEDWRHGAWSRGSGQGAPSLELFSFSRMVSPAGS